MQNITTIIFDVDGTLSEDISWLKLTHGLGASADAHAAIFDAFKAGILSYPEAKRQLIQLWQATGNANKSFMLTMFQNWELKADAADTLRYLRGKYRVCLMSGAVDLYVEVVAEKLRVPEWFANTELIWDEQEDLIDFNYFADQSAKKLEHFREYAARHDTRKSNCAIVGDGDSDVALFRELPVSIAIGEEVHASIEKFATHHIHALNELKSIL